MRFLDVGYGAQLSERLHRGRGLLLAWIVGTALYVLGWVSFVVRIAAEVSGWHVAGG